MEQTANVRYLLQLSDLDGYRLMIYDSVAKEPVAQFKDSVVAEAVHVAMNREEIERG